jgi:Leucine-rich repeat (LRR) protein
MKIFYLNFCFLFIISFGGFAQNVNIPDPNFKAILLADTAINTDANKLEISVAEATAFTGSIGSNPSLYGKSITSLQGIEAFVNITKLDCGGNRLTSLDISKNTKLTSFNCSSNSISTLDFSKNVALTYIGCAWNKLTNLDLGNNLLLQGLDCQVNEITSLNIIKNTELTNLLCYSNSLTGIDLVNKGKLTYLNCFRNKIINLDVSNCPLLTSLEFSENKLTSIDISKNTLLTKLDCSRNNFAHIDISNNTKLTTFWSYYNNLSSLDPSKNTLLTDLKCSNNKIANIDVSKNPLLTSLYISGNRITNIGLSFNTKLQYLHCDNNLLSNLDISKIVNLYSLTCNANPDLYCVKSLNTQTKTNWTKDAYQTFGEDCYTYNNVYIPDANFKAALLANASLNFDEDKTNITFWEAKKYQGAINVANLNIASLTGIEAFFNITALHCERNQLTSLDIGKCNALTSLTCQNNQLKTIPVTTKMALTEFNCSYNLFEKLDVSNNKLLATFNCSNNPSLTCIGALETQVKTNWIKDATQAFSIECAYVYIPDSIFKARLLATKAINTDTDSTSISFVEAKSYIGNLYVGGSYSEKITSLTGIEAFENITYLYCSYNNLSSIDLSKNTALKKLECSINQLVSLDVSHQKALTSLNFSANKLTSIDLSNNTALVDLNGGSNSLSNIDLSKNTALTVVSVSGNLLTALDVSRNTALNSLSCTHNQITNLDVSNNMTLKTLNCYNNQLTAINLGKINTVTEFNLQYNKFTRLDLTHLKLLSNLNCSYNQLASLDVSKSPTLNNLDIKSNISLTCIGALESQIKTNWKKDSTQFFSQNCAVVYIPDARFKAALLANVAINTDSDLLNISYAEALPYKGAVVVRNLGIASLIGIEVFVNITALYCDSNQLRSFDIANNIALKSLSCSSNLLTSLDVSNIKTLVSLSCVNNASLSCIGALDTQIKTNWTKDATATYSESCASVYIPDVNFKARLLASTTINTDADKSNISFAEAAAYKGSIDVMNYGQGNDIYSLTGLEAFVNISRLDCRNNNKITKIDVSQNKLISVIWCDNNAITSLDLSNNKDLYSLSANGNKLTSLNVSNNLQLSNLSINSNTQLTSLDVSNNKKLFTFYCTNNPKLTCIGAFQSQIRPNYWTKDTSARYSESCASVYIPDANFKAKLLANAAINTDADKLEISYAEAKAYKAIIEVVDAEIESLKGIEAFVNITGLKCDSNKISSLDVSKNTMLTTLSCVDNQIANLDVSANSALMYFLCNNNLLKTLDVSKNPVLYSLNCAANPELTCIGVLNTQNKVNWIKDDYQKFSINCSGSVGIEDDHMTVYKTIVNIFNMEGQKVNMDYKGFVIYLYSDGTSAKMMNY